MIPFHFSPIRRKVFISFHHGNDQGWFERFRNTFGTGYEVFYDNSLDGHVRSDDAEYVDRKIREDYIVGSSITIVLCGAETWKRKYVDWEIYATLYHKHALLGIALPTASRNVQSQIVVPDRLHVNIKSGYAQWLPTWPPDATALKTVIEAAIAKSAQTLRIDNSAAKMQRNKP